MIDGYQEQLQKFMDIWETSVRNNSTKQFGDDHLVKSLREEPKGRKYSKITDGSCVCCFVEKSTGDIFKPAGWKAPAKHVRGNIFSKDTGMEAVQGSFVYSVRYLK